jgi:hypothetical protein
VRVVAVAHQHRRPGYWRDAYDRRIWSSNRHRWSAPARPRRHGRHEDFQSLGGCGQSLGKTWACVS